MAQLKPLIPVINRLADIALKTGSASQKIGFETVVKLEYDTSLAGPGTRVTISHYTTEIISAHIRPQGLASTPPRLYRLTVDNGGYRSVVTYARLRELLKPFGVHITRVDGKQAVNGDLLSTPDGHGINLYRRSTLYFNEAGVVDGGMIGEGRAYPTADEVEALDWTYQTLAHGDFESLRTAVANAYYIARQNATPHMGYSEDAEATYNFVRRDRGRGPLLSTFNGIRRHQYACKYGAPDTAESLACIVEAYLDDQIATLRSIIASVEYGGNTGTRESAADCLRRTEAELAALIQQRDALKVAA